MGRFPSAFGWVACPRRSCLAIREHADPRLRRVTACHPPGPATQSQPPGPATQSQPPGPARHWSAGPTSGILSGMNENHCLPRSPELMSATDTGLLVVDVQEKLIAAIADGPRVVLNARRLVDGAEVLGLPVAGTEQYPRGLGPTVPELAGRLGEVPSKLSFSCGGCPEIFRDLEGRGVHKLLVCGIETHVCVQQTVLDLLATGWRVYVAVDAVASRFEMDHRTALGRMDSAGATLTTTEAALFEWCQRAGTPEFKAISLLAKQQGP